MLLEKSKKSQVLSQLPKVLALNSVGTPLDWITYQRTAYLYAKEKVLWSLGTHEIVLHGGTNAETGKQSVLVMDTIIAVGGTKFNKPRKHAHPALCNKTLFERDKHLCAYCGSVYNKHILTRDHVTPTSRGGEDTWVNCVTACKSCNQRKDNRTPEQANMKLLYVPYSPNFYEHLILKERKSILADQMAFLLNGVSKNSRLLIA